MIHSKKALAGICSIILSLNLVACGGTNNTDSSSRENNATTEVTSTADTGTTTTVQESEIPASTTEHGTVEISDERLSKLNINRDDMPKNALANKTIKFMAYSDINNSNGKSQSEALKLFTEIYGGNIEYVPTTWETRFNDLAAAILAKDSPDFIPAVDLDSFPKCAYKGLIDYVDNYVDLDSNLWKSTKFINDKFIYNNNHYVLATGAYPNNVCIYNKKTIKENHLEDPATLYKSNKWTWDKFEEMCAEFSDRAADKYGIDGYWAEKAIVCSTGTPLISLNDTGEAVNNLTNENVIKAENFLYHLADQSIFFDRWEHGGIRGDGTTGVGMADGLTLFYPCGLWAIEATTDTTKVFGDMAAGDIMFVPMPRPSDTDVYYVDSRVENAYHLVKNAPNPEGFITYMACEQAVAKSSSESKRNQLISDYGWNQEMVDMRDELIKLSNESPVFDFSYGISDDVSKVIDEVKYKSTVDEKTMVWDKVISDYNDKLDFYIKEANTTLGNEQ